MTAAVILHHFTTDFAQGFAGMKSNKIHLANFCMHLTQCTTWTSILAAGPENTGTMFAQIGIVMKRRYYRNRDFIDPNSIVYVKKEKDYFKWVFALIVFALAMMVTFSEVG